MVSLCCISVYKGKLNTSKFQSDYPQFKPGYLERKKAEFPRSSASLGVAHRVICNLQMINPCCGQLKANTV